MIRMHPWLVALCYWVVVSALPGSTSASGADPTARAGVKVMFLFKEIGQEGIQAVENALTRVFKQHGCSILDREIMTQTLQTWPTHPLHQCGNKPTVFVKKCNESMRV